MKRLLVPAILLSMKKVAFTILCCAVLMFIAAPAWADQCSFPLSGNEVAPACGVLITISGSTGNLTSTITTPGSSYDGDDQLVGIQNNSSVKVGAIILSGPNLFAFDTDGACDFFAPVGCPFGPTHYEGPKNTFVGISSDKTTGKVLFNTPLAASGGATWFSLQGAPTTVVSIGENQTLTANSTAIYRFGPFSPPSSGSQTETSGQDDIKITPLNSASGDTLTVTPKRVAASNFGAGNFPNLKCIPYFDYSAGEEPVCVELEMDCSSPHEGGDLCGFTYTSQLDYGLDDRHGLNPLGIGGPALLVAPNPADCPTTGFTENIVVSYTGAATGAPTSSDPPPIKGGGNGKSGQLIHSCQVSAYDPNATPVPVGVTVSTVSGFEVFVSDTRINPVFQGVLPVVLIFDRTDISGNGIPNLQLCKMLDTSTDPATCPSVSAPWVYLSLIPLHSNNPKIDAACKAVAAQSSPLPLFNGLNNVDEVGEYVAVWNTGTTVKGLRGCQVRVQLQFQDGMFFAPARFQYVFN